MSKFNETKKQTSRTENLAGGKAYKQSPELEVVTTLLTSFAGDTFYESANATTKRLREAISHCDPKFVAKALIYARNEFGMRSITHVGASILAPYIGGTDYAKEFYNRIVRRADDMLEITAYHLSQKQKLSNAMKCGFAKAIGRFDKYQLAKYKGDNKSVKMVDMVNLCHPVQTEKNDNALTELVNGTLRSFDTWEVELSAAGGDTEAKKDVWRKLITENKLGYFALLRNIRNIVQLGDADIEKLAYEALTNVDAIKKSLVLPFRFATAYKELKPISNNALRYISRACDISCNNVPEFNGKTLVALDVSGSMRGKPSEIGSLFSAAFGRKGGDVDIMVFDTQAAYIGFNPDLPILSIAEQIPFNGGGTNFDCVFQKAMDAKKRYDRIILLSDMNSWSHSWYGGSSQSGFNKYRKAFNAECKLYSFDLNASGTMLMPEDNVFCIAGFSEKIFDVMANMEVDKKALITAVNTIEL